MAEAALFSLRYAGGVDYYAVMLRCGKVFLDFSEQYDKRNKGLHRMDIVNANGCQSLSVPLCKPNRAMQVGEVGLSEHGNWRHNHWGALFSAYGRTPFFDFFADDLKAIYEDETIETIASLDYKIHCSIVSFLDLPIETIPFFAEGNCSDMPRIDMRDGVFATTYCFPEYNQIWEAKHGFRQGLSILDLLFNMGREAVFYLRR